MQYLFDPEDAILSKILKVKYPLVHSQTSLKICIFSTQVYFLNTPVILFSFSISYKSQLVLSSLFNSQTTELTIHAAQSKKDTFNSCQLGLARVVVGWSVILPTQVLFP
jgi:hypothetical protein